MTISALAFFSKSGSAGEVTGTFTITSSAPSTDTVVLSLMSPDVYSFASPLYQITNVPIIAGKATGTFTGLSAGTYGVRADDQAGGGAAQAFFDAVVTISGAAASAPNDPTDITVSAQTETSAGLTGVADLTGTTPDAWELQSSAIGGAGAGDWAGTGSQAGNTWTVTPGTTVGTYRRIRAGAGGLWSGWYYEQIGYLNPVEGGGGPLDEGAIPPGVAPTTVLSVSSNTVTAKGSIVLTANISDSSGIGTATWLMNGVEIGTSNIGAAGTVVAISVARAILFADARSNGTISFQVRAEDTDGNSSLSNIVTVTVSLGSEMTDITTGLGAEMEIQRRDTSRAILFSLFTPLGAALHGAVPSISLVKAGAMGFNNSAAQAATGVCAEVGTSGLYAYIPSEDDINTEGRLIIYPAATGAAPVAPIQAVVVTPYGAR